MEELYVNDILVELPLNSVAQTLQINDIGELKDRQANYSNNIKIPKTPKNIRTFEMLGIAGTTTRVPYENVVVKYVVDGIELISKGKGVIKNTNNYYNLVIYDGNIEMVDLLGDLKLYDLDFSSYNHNLTTDIYINSFANTSGYIYGLGRFYDFDNLNNITINLQNSSFYVHTLFEMIFNQKGYTISGDIFSDTDYLSRVISMAKGYERVSFDNKTNVYYNTPSVTISEDFGAVKTTKQYLIDSYTILNSDVYTINLSGNISLAIGTYYKLVIKNSAVKIAEAELINGINEIDINIQALVSDEIKVYIEATSEIITTNEEIAFQTLLSKITFYQNTIYTEINYNNIIGDIKQIDFVKDIMQRFGLIFRKTRNVNNYEFVQMKTLLSDVKNVENWSSKYSTFSDENYKSSYAKTNIAKYIYDDNDSNIEPTFANGEFYINDENLSNDTTLFTSVFKASEYYFQYPKLQQWELDDEQIVIKEDGNRIYKINKLNNSFSLKYNDSVENVASYSGYIPYLDFVNIYYQNELDNNYKEVNFMLDNYKKITLELNLSLVDIYNIDFFKLKTFNQLGKYYYLNKIISFKKNKSTKVELVEISEVAINNIFMSGESNGEATTDATLYVLDEGEISGISYGEATTEAFLRVSSVTSFMMSSIGGEEIFVCSLSADTTYYHNGIGTYPTINDTVYTDIAGTTPLNGNNDFWNLASSDYVQIDTNGKIINKSSC